MNIYMQFPVERVRKVFKKVILYSIIHNGYKNKSITSSQEIPIQVSRIFKLKMVAIHEQNKGTGKTQETLVERPPPSPHPTSSIIKNAGSATSTIYIMTKKQTFSWQNPIDCHHLYFLSFFFNHCSVETRSIIGWLWIGSLFMISGVSHLRFSTEPIQKDSFLATDVTVIHLINNFQIQQK